MKIATDCWDHEAFLFYAISSALVKDLLPTAKIRSSISIRAPAYAPL